MFQEYTQVLALTKDAARATNPADFVLNAAGEASAACKADSLRQTDSEILGYIENSFTSTLPQCLVLENNSATIMFHKSFLTAVDPSCSANTFSIETKMGSPGRDSEAYLAILQMKSEAMCHHSPLACVA